jgi:hypothetical protein
MSKKRVFNSGSQQLTTGSAAGRGQTTGHAPTFIGKTLNPDVSIKGQEFDVAVEVVFANYRKNYRIITELRKQNMLGRRPDLNMPEISQKFLPFILPRKLRAAVAGDLAEDFRTYATQWGRPYAVRWLWWELGGLCIRRFGPTAIITTIGVWFRQKIGW